MQQMPLSTLLADLRDSFARYRETGMEMAPEAVANLQHAFGQLAQRALSLEEAERQLSEMEAIAQDLNVMARRQAAAKAAATIPGTNVVAFPIIARDRKTGGDAA